LTLLLEQASRGDALVSAPQRSHDLLFAYFAEQVFGRVSETTQRFLMETAVLPTIPVSAATALTANAQAGAILEDLYKRRLFTHRRPSTERTYWYHGLFRAFLLARAEHHLPAAQRVEGARKAAKLLATAGQYEDAFALYRQARDWQAAARLVLERAENLLANGRWQTLREWIAFLPQSCLDETPWLKFWLGNALMPVDQTEARLHLQHAFEKFRQQNELMGQLRSASSIVASYFFEWSGWTALDGWIDSLEELMLACPRYPSVAIELDVCSGMLIAALYRRPGHRMLPLCADRIETLIDCDLDLNRTVAGATLLLTYCNLSNHLQRGQGIVSRMQPLIERDEVTPLNRVWWYCRLTWFLGACGRNAEVDAPTYRAHKIVETHSSNGLRGTSVILDAHLHVAMLGRRDWKRAEELSRRLTEAAHISRPSDQWLASYTRLCQGLATGDVEGAVREFPRTIDTSAPTGMTYLEVASEAVAAEALVEAGRADEALKHVLRCRALIEGTCFAYLEPELRVLEAYAARCKEDMARCHQLLADAFALAKRVDITWRHIRLFRAFPTMCREALSAGIEPDYVRSVIRRFGLRPTSPEDPAWPWSVKIYTLGCFEIWREGQLLKFPHKAPRKQLLVLKALLAFGGSDVPARRLADTIWPDEEGDASWSTLSVNLARLRALLGSQDSITMTDGQISLNPDCCWWDARAFDRQCGKHHIGLAEPLALYRGPFLPAEADQPWSVPLRERLRARFVRDLQHRAVLFEKEGAWARAAVLYVRGIETEELAEELYQGLMRCYQALRRPAEGLAAYRRLRQQLSVVLGIAPTPDSDALYRALTDLGSTQPASG
jgi:DNA-binding SARP family transcriptional activator